LIEEGGVRYRKAKVEITENHDEKGKRNPKTSKKSTFACCAQVLKRINQHNVVGGRRSSVSRRKREGRKQNSEMITLTSFCFWCWGNRQREPGTSS